MTTARLSRFLESSDEPFSRSRSTRCFASSRRAVALRSLLPTAATSSCSGRRTWPEYLADWRSWPRPRPCTRCRGSERRTQRRSREVRAPPGTSVDGHGGRHDRQHAAEQETGWTAAAQTHGRPVPERHLPGRAVPAATLPVKSRSVSGSCPCDSIFSDTEKTRDARTCLGNVATEVSP